MIKIEEKHSEFEKTIEKLNNGEYLKYDELQAFKEYHKELESELDFKNSILRNSKDKEVAKKYITEIETEFEEIDFIKTMKVYKSTLVSLYYMNATIERVFELDNSGYSTNPFFDFKKLVEQINAYFEIEKPYKPSNKIAYGWKFCLEKCDKSCFYKNCRLYLFGCIKNYLIKNGVEFDKNMSLNVRKIVGLVDLKDTIE